jgi:hypothetical protein
MTLADHALKARSAKEGTPNSVKPHPEEEPVGGEEPKLTRALPPQDGHLMAQGGAAANTEREPGNEERKNCDHAHEVWR